MIGATPQIDKDYYFKIGNYQFALGLSEFDRTLAISYQTSASADKWTWIATELIPDNSAKYTMQQWIDWLKLKLANLTKMLKDWLTRTGTPPETEIPALSGDAALLWLIKNKVSVDSAGNITLNV